MKKWYFTFGCDQGINSYKCQVIKASCEYYARAKMFELYGNKFCTSYDEDTWNKMKNDPNRRFPLEQELPEVLVVSDEEAQMLIDNGVFN